MLTNKYIYIYILLLTAYTIIIKIDLWLRNNSWTTQTLHLGSWHLLLLSGPSSVTPQTQKPPGNTWERLASRMVCSLTWPSWSFQPFKKTTKPVASPQRDEFPEKSGSFLENMGPQSQSKLFLCFCRSFWYDCQVINFYKLTDWNCQQFPIAPSSPTRRPAATSCSIQLSRCSPLFLGNRKTEGLCMEPLETIIYLSEIPASICIDN